MSLTWPDKTTVPQTSQGRVLIVDDEPANVALLAQVVTRVGFDAVSVPTGALALSAVESERPDIVLLDVNMPGLDGFETCRRLKADPRTKLLPVVLITGLSAIEDRVRGIEAGADDFLTKPFVLVELRARVRSLVRLKHYTDELDSAESVILTLAHTIEARDPHTHGHCERLAHYATTLGTHLGLDQATLVALHRGGYLHDVGKIGIPDAVLLKPGPLTAAEYAVMQQHTVIGDQLCGDLRALRNVRSIIRHHHERADGSGYPDHLKGDEVPLPAQIIGIVDAYDAMTTDRPYKAARTPAQACSELGDEADRGWKNAALVDAFVGLVEQNVLGSSICHNMTLIG